MDSENSRWTWQGMVYDLCFYALLFLILSGGIPFLPDSLHALIQSKPWIHRALTAGLSLVLVFQFWAYRGWVQKGKAAWTPVMEAFFSIRMPSHRGLLTVFCALTAFWSYSSWVRHDSFHTAFDMAIFTQAIWNTLQGDFLYSSIKGGISLLGDHFSPLLFLYAIPYAVWGSPKCLLFLQAALVASSVFPLYRIAKNKLQADRPAWIFILCFVLYLPLRNAVRFDFHPEMAAIPFLFWAFLWIQERKLFKASLALFLVVLSKENAALVTLALGIYTVWRTPHKKFGWAWSIFSALYFYWVIQYVIPSFSGRPYFYLSGNFLAWKDSGLSGLLGQLFNKSSLIYGIKVFAPLGFLSLLHPPTLFLTLPILLHNLTARNEMVRSIFFHYTAFLIPFIFISAIYGMAVLQGRKQGFRWMLVCSILMAGVSEYYIIHHYQERISPHSYLIQKKLQSIPITASLRTNELLSPHAAHRKQLHIFENNHPLEGGSEAAANVDYVAVDQAYLSESGKAEIALLEAGNYTKTFEDGSFVIFQRSSAGE